MHKVQEKGVVMKKYDYKVEAYNFISKQNRYDSPEVYKFIHKAEDEDPFFDRTRFQAAILFKDLWQIDLMNEDGLGLIL